MPRIEREKKVIGRMVAIYCHRHHGRPADSKATSGHHGNHSDRDSLCDDCRELLEYARQRLDRCPHGNRKPSCRKCTIHCYSSARRQQMQAVMRYVGPRMLFLHPLTAIRHLLDEMKPTRQKLC